MFLVAQIDGNCSCQLGRKVYVPRYYEGARTNPLAIIFGDTTDWFVQLRQV
jgi:hypothetical protein